MQEVYILKNNGCLLGAFTEVAKPYCWSMLQDTLKVRKGQDSVEWRGAKLRIDQPVKIAIDKKSPVAEVTKIVLEDNLANQWVCVVEDLSQVVQVYGLEVGGAHFESEAIHLQEWCYENEVFYRTETHVV